jgi:hypothetical protein
LRESTVRGGQGAGMIGGVIDASPERHG